MTAVLSDRPVWSRSQATAFRDCARKFALSAKAARETRPPEAERLKALKSRHLWTGGAVHTAVADLIRAARAGGEIAPEDDWVGTVRDRLRGEFEASRSNAADGVRLFEHEYGVSVSREAWRENWEKAERALRWFYSSKWLERLRKLRPEHWKAVDEVLDFDADGVRAYAKIDCAVETDDGVVLIDWKTGPLREGDGAGLDVAMLYAHDVWGADPATAQGWTVSLLDGASRRRTFDPDALIETQLRIQEEAFALAEAAASFAADPLAAPAPPTLAPCARCNFQKLCHPEGLGRGRGR